MLLRKIIFPAMIALSMITTSASAIDKALPKPIQEYIQQIENDYHFTHQELVSLFQQAHFNKQIIELMNHPYEAKPWPEYRKYFITQQRVSDGVHFWNQHRQTLQQAEEKYGVPASIIVAIIGVETHYGHYIGAFPVIDTLTTLSFYYPSRAHFFRNELTEYLLLTREQKLKPLQLTGSYAGAMGIPQFMPSVYRHYAVDASNKGSANLYDVNDAIFSIANYLSKMGWKENQPIASLLHADAIDDELLSNSAKPVHTLDKLKAKGIEVPDQSGVKKAAIIKLASEDVKSQNYWLTFANFRAIMRYNPRIHYAMAVYQLSEAIKDARQQSTITVRAKSPSTRKVS